MKKAVLALILLSLLISLAGCSSKQKKAEEEAMQYALQMSYDSVAADIDGDGLVEDCYLSHGTTSGVLTVVITAVANDTVKYRNTFYLNTSRFPRFSMEEGVLRLRLERHNYATDEQTVEYCRVYADGKRIVLEGLRDKGEGYWGGSKWNWDMDSDEAEDWIP